MIKFSWHTGSICVDPEVLIREMTLANYRKWLKLFIRYGRREDHISMVNCLCDSLILIHDTIRELEAKVARLEGFGGRILGGERRIARKKLSAANRQRVRIIKMWDLLGGQLS